LWGGLAYAHSHGNLDGHGNTDGHGDAYSNVFTKACSDSAAASNTAASPVARSAIWNR
jgi:hypothetical protein